MADPPSTLPRPGPGLPSALPRPSASRLPVLRSSVSYSQLRAPASPEPLRKKPSLAAMGSTTTTTTTTLHKKASRASLANPPTIRPSAMASRRASGIPSINQPRPISTSPANEAPVFRRPFVRPSSRQSKASAPAAHQDEDTLGQLEGFRSASRASSLAESRDGHLDSEPEHIPDAEFASSADLSLQPAPKKKSRPSLSERTVESLSQLPSSPAAGKTRRRSSFFAADNTMGPPLRSSSALSSNSSRPTTSEGPTNPIPATPRRLGGAIATSRLSMTAPGKRTVSAGIATPTATPMRTPLTVRSVSTVKKPLSLTQNLQNTTNSQPPAASKNITARTPKSRPSLTPGFSQASAQPLVAAPLTPSLKSNMLSNKTPQTSRKVATSTANLRVQPAKNKTTPAASLDAVAPSTPKVPSGSSVLREQIAKAREAARRGKVEALRTITPPKDAIVPDPAEIATFDFGLDDPFNQRTKGAKSLLRKRIDGARVDGRLNLAAMGLHEIPDDVLSMYKYDAADSAVAWSEVVDLGVMLLADNELEALPEAMFPDIDGQEMAESDETGPQFGGVHTIDLHGNRLRALPVGLNRLSLLSKLNLSRNKLPMEVFDVITRIHGIRELKLAENDLQGDLPASLCNLLELEVLDVQSNKITTIPCELGHLSRLRTMNVTDNQIQTLPMELFDSPSLIELQASKNKLGGTLFSIDAALYLQELNVANNSLLAFCEGNSIALPAIKNLVISTNRLTMLPAVSDWTNLTTLLVGENKLSVLPEGFATLQQLRTADFTCNDITQLDERIALMRSLTSLTLAANPLRDKKFLTMNTEDMKRDLASRLQPDDSSIDDMESVFTNGAAEDHAVSKWQPSHSGSLDLSSQTLSTISEADLEPFTETIRQLYLQQNTFASVPLSISLLTNLTILDLSRNALETTFTTPLHLPKVRELRFAHNKLICLSSLTTNLTAPLLQTLDVSHNRLTGTLPSLALSYPDICTLLASDNSIADVTPESLAHLKIVNLSNNDLERLEPAIGLLHHTLTSFDVAGNKFRVPNWQVLGKGTEAVLTWLRGRIPRDSWRSDGTEFFDADDTF